MVQSVDSKSMSQHQISLIEQALRQVSKIEASGWDEIPIDLQVSFARYMGEECWTHLPDLFTLRTAALMIIRDAIARAGEFSDGVESMSVGG
jgi:hypothetical protein